VTTIKNLSEQIKKRQQQIDKIAKQAQAHQKQADKITQTYLSPIDKFLNQNIGPIDNAIKRVQSTYETMIKNINWNYLENFAKQTIDFLENLEKSKDLTLQSQVWLVDNGWPPLIHVAWNAPAKIKNYCTKNNLNNKDIAKLLEKEIVNFHDSEMINKNILLSWNDNFVSKQRLKILKSAVQAHLEGKYELSVPVFISQIEGIPQAYFNYSNQKFDERSCNEYFNAKDNSSKEIFLEILFRYLTDIVFVSGKGNEELLNINRNKILHGEYVNYAKESVSLKLILIVDILLTYPKFVSLPRASVYHVPHCPSFKKAKKNNKKKHRTIHTEMSAKASGLMPCKRCLNDKCN